MNDWIKEFPAAITVMDKAGIIIEMNEKACTTFAKYGGAELIGTSVYDCHPPYACEIIRQMLISGQPNSYTIEKQGLTKLIHQQPYFVDGELAGIVEISIELPSDMKHHVRN